MTELEKCPSCGGEMEVWNPGRCSWLEGFRAAGRCVECDEVFVDDRDPDDPGEKRLWVSASRFFSKEEVR